MKFFKTALAASLITLSYPSFAQSSIQNPITQAVLAAYEEELNENPRNYNVLINRADEYYRHDEYIRALADVDKVLEYTPAAETDVRLRAYILRAGIYNETKRPAQALEDLKEADRLAPSHTQYYIRKVTQNTFLAVMPRQRMTFNAA